MQARVSGCTNELHMDSPSMSCQTTATQGQKRAPGRRLGRGLRCETYHQTAQATDINSAKAGKATVPKPKADESWCSVKGDPLHVC